MSREHLCRLDGETIQSLQDVYAQLAEQLGFPVWFDPNLDALWDVLTTDVRGPVRVVWVNAERSRWRLGQDFERLRTLLEAVARQRADFTFELDSKVRAS